MVDTQALAAIRKEIRFEEHSSFLGAGWDTGGCGIVSEVMGRDYGWERWGGCYLPGDGRHIAHYWNRLPDDRIIDVTADQFGEPGDGVRVTEWHDPRYASWCECGGTDG